MTRTVHNISAKYNGYFNANELIKETKSSFLNARVEDYSTILPLYPLPSIEESKSWYAPMDTAIRKCELVIVKNRMPNVKKGRNRYKEWCRWIDDNWMTIGIAQYYKKDFPEALNTFKYVKNHYPLEKSYYESQFWEAKVLIEMNAFEEAEEILLNLITLFVEQNEDDQENEKKLKINEKIRFALNYEERKEYLENNGIKISESLLNKVYPTLSDLYLKSKQIDEAKESLDISIKSKQKKAFQARMIFILAQLYHKEGDIKASQLYNEVIEMNPEYEMAFQAKINRALSFSDGDTKAIRNQLLKMLKDDKNIDFYDQIYFALAEIAFKEKKEDIAVEYLHLSINSSKSNNPQKVKSLLGLANWFYKTKDYKSSFLYFDTTSKTINKKDPNYSYVTQNLKVLKTWNQANSTVLKNDSILNLCTLSQTELSDVMLDYIDKLEKAKEEKNKENEVSYYPGGLSRLPSIPSNSSKIFFWDENLKGLGYNEFRNLWGERVLEDNWRRSIKTNFNSKEELIDSTSNSGDEISVDLLISQLPCGDSIKTDSINQQTLDALFEIGILHHYQIIDLNESKNNFNRIINQFQPADKSIASLYELYLIHEAQGNNKLKNETKETLIKTYPKSKYAKLLLDPNSKKELEKNKLKEEEYYTGLFDEYKKGEYAFVIDETNKKTKDTLNPLYCEYALLNAYAFGKANASDSLNPLIKRLKKVSKLCEGSEPGMYANEVLSVLLTNKSESQQNDKGNIFAFNPNKSHSFLLFAPKGSVDMNKSKNKIADFNKTSFSKDQLKTKSVFLNTSDQMILVENFKNSNDAMDYYTAFKVNKGGVSDLQKQKFFIISPENLTKLYLEKNIKNYEIFFKDFYILD